jgi:poly(3-hydroxybutyrate) depolymerase
VPISACKDHALPRGSWKVRGESVRPSALRDTAILTIEGELDDISGLGQTRAALDLASKLPAAAKQH